VCAVDGVCVRILRVSQCVLPAAAQTRRALSVTHHRAHARSVGAAGSGNSGCALLTADKFFLFCVDTGTRTAVRARSRAAT
jgi:hypothetical protein